MNGIQQNRFFEEARYIAVTMPRNEEKLDTWLIKLFSLSKHFIRVPNATVFLKKK